MDSSSVENYLIPSAARGLRVLLVDHDTTSLMYIASVLEEQFYKVRTTELASVGLSMIREREDQFDLVMADINMPEMDIFTFLKSILLRRDMPIILMSFGANMDMARKALNEGACFFLQKPVRIQDLINVWQHVYRKRRWQKMDIEKKVIPKKESHGGKIVEVDSASKSAAKYDLHNIDDKHLQTGIWGEDKQIKGEVSLVEGNRVGESQDICRERMVTVGKENQGESRKVQEKTREKDSCGGEIIEKMDGVSRVTGGNDLHGINNEHLPIDTSVKNLRNEGEVDIVLGGECIEKEHLMTIEKGKEGESKRKRVNDDYNGKRSEERSNLRENNSKGMKPFEGKERERKQKDNSILEKKSRMNWSPELHLKFMEAISLLGEKKAHPKAVLEMMKVPNLTHRHVASHLQKYRDRVKRISEAGATTTPLTQSKMTRSTFTFYTGKGFPQMQEQHNSMKNSQGLKTPKFGIGASTKQFIPPISLASPKLHVGSSVTLNYADLFTNLTEKTHSYHTNNFNKNQVPSSGKLHGLTQIRGVATFPNAINWSENGKGNQPLGFDALAENFSHVTPEIACPIISTHMYQSTGLNQETDFKQGQICPSSTSKANNFPTDFHDANQELNVIAGLASTSCSLNQKQSSVDFSDLLAELEVFNAELNDR